VQLLVAGLVHRLTGGAYEAVDATPDVLDQAVKLIDDEDAPTHRSGIAGFTERMRERHSAERAAYLDWRYECRALRYCRARRAVRDWYVQRGVPMTRADRIASATASRQGSCSPKPQSEAGSRYLSARVQLTLVPSLKYTAHEAQVRQLSLAA
jgi:hypothetical protein